LAFKKEFDTIDHEKLHRYGIIIGIRGNVHRWFKSHIQGRQQLTSIDKHGSNMSFFKCGVPQGSALGPILFLI